MKEISVTKWHKILRRRPCVVCGIPGVQLHHCHGGSMNDVLPPHLRPGMGQRVSEWLVIPLYPTYHVGRLGIDTGMGAFRSVVAWEENIGTQVAFIDQICREYGVNVWRRAGVDRDPA